MLLTRKLTGQNMDLKKTSEDCTNAFTVVNMCMFRLNQKLTKHGGSHPSISGTLR